MEIDGKDPGLGCNHVDYGKGYTLVVFDLSSEVTDAAFPGEITIDQARSIQLT